jgi:hypothetical protein
MLFTTAAGSWPGFGSSRPAMMYLRISAQLKNGVKDEMLADATPGSAWSRSSVSR